MKIIITNLWFLRLDPGCFSCGKSSLEGQQDSDVVAVTTHYLKRKNRDRLDEISSNTCTAKRGGNSPWNRVVTLPSCFIQDGQRSIRKAEALWNHRSKIFQHHFSRLKPSVQSAEANLSRFWKRFYDAIRDWKWKDAIAKRQTLDYGTKRKQCWMAKAQLELRKIAQYEGGGFSCYRIIIIQLLVAPFDETVVFPSLDWNSDLTRVNQY